MTIQTQTIPMLQEAYSTMLYGGLGSSGAQIQEIKINQLAFFTDQVYRMYTQDEMLSMIESIKENGVLHPVIVRPWKEDTYQVLSGRNRVNCARLAVLCTVPCIVKNCDELQARLIVNDTNLCQRKRLSMKELAFGYKEQLDTIKQLSQGKKTVAAIADATTENVKTIQRYIRLTYLIPELFCLIEKKKYSMTTGVSLSYLTEENQRMLYEFLVKFKNVKLKDEQLQRIRQMERLTLEPLTDIFAKKDDKLKRQCIKITYDELKSLGFVLQSQGGEQIKEQIMMLLWSHVKNGKGESK